MSYDPAKDKILKTWRIPITDNQTAIINLISYDGGVLKLQVGPVEIERDGKVIYGRIARWGWDEFQQLQEVMNQAEEEVLRLQIGGTAGETAKVGSWIFYSSLQKTLLKLWKKENPRGYRLLLAHIAERVEKKGEDRGFRIRIDKFLSEALTGNRGALKKLARQGGRLAF